MDSKIKLQKSTDAESQTQFHAWYGALSSADKEQFDQYHKRKKFCFISKSAGAHPFSMGLKQKKRQ